MRRTIPRPRRTWDAESDERLLDAVKLYGTYNWNIGGHPSSTNLVIGNETLFLVARHVAEDATAGQCQSRYSRSLDPSIKRGQWSEEEDSRLCLAVAAYGNSWMEIASVIPGRTNEQCRDRWSEKLKSPTVKSKWTDEENQSLVEAVKDLGNRWKTISERLGHGRTDSKVTRFLTLAIHFDILICAFASSVGYIMINYGNKTPSFLLLPWDCPRLDPDRRKLKGHHRLQVKLSILRRVLTTRPRHFPHT
jgi:hypothetical protein